MFVDIINLLLYNTVVLLFLGFIGKLLLYFLRIQITGIYKKTFFEFLSSMLCLAFFTALYYTKGKTVLIFLILPVGILLYQYYSNKNTSKQFTKIVLYPKIWLLTILVSLFFTLFTYLTLNTGNGYINPPNPDYVFNAKNSVFLATFGLENISFEYFYRDNMGVSPYHYFELWLNVLLYNTLHLPALNTLIFILFPIGISCIFLGFCALGETFGHVNIKIYFLSFFFIFFTAFYPFFYKNIYILDTASAFVTNVLIYPKLFSIYLFLQAFILLFQSKHYIIAYTLLLIIPILFISTIISILMSASLYFLIHIYFNKQKRTLYIKMLGLYVLYAIVILSFYYLFKDSNNVTLSQASSLPIFKISYYIIVIKTIILTLIRHFVLYIPIIVIILCAIFKYNKLVIDIFKSQYTLFCSLLYITALLASAIFNQMGDSVQLFTNITTALINVNSFFLVMIFEKKRILKRTTLYSIISVCLLFNIYTTCATVVNKEMYFSEDYRSKIKSILRKTDYIGAFMQQSTKTSFIFAPDLYTPGQYMNLVGNYHLIHLSVFESYSGTKEKEAFLQTSTFYKFVQKQKNNNQFRSIAQSQIDFVKEHKISYLIVPKSMKLDNQWEAMIEQEFIDSKSGERFILLKKT